MAKLPNPNAGPNVLTTASEVATMDYVSHWFDTQFTVDCPISFTEQESESHKEGMENRDYIERLMEEFQDAGIIPVDGVVEPEDYEVLKETSDAKERIHVLGRG